MIKPALTAFAATDASSDATLLSDSTIRAVEPGAPLGPGVRVAPHLVLDKIVGRGGMGVVYRAWQDDLERWVAIKFVSCDLGSDDLEGAIFKNEVRAMARCPHPNVVPIYATGDYQGIPFFVMDFVEGQSLQEWIEGATVFDEARYAKAIGIILQACDAVAHLHANGLIHRDIKSSNLLLKADSTVQLTDFGVARQTGAIGFKGYVVGSPRYMAPEVFFGDAPPETEYLRDVYALGCLAFEILTGVHAFSADAAGEYMRMHMFDEAQRPSRVRPEVPAAFDAVIARALAKEPWDRTQSVAELRRQLVEAHESSREPERILVLDDDADWAELVSAVLRRRFKSARVDVIDNPQEALLAVDLERYSLIVADLQMPLLSGLEWTRRVRSTSRGKNLPVIIVTGSGGAAEWKEATSLGVAGVLLKPVHGDDLVNMVSRVLRETRASEPPAAG